MKKWDITNEFRMQNSEFRIDDLIKTLLANRNLKTKKEIEEFLHPKLESVTVDAVGINKEQLAKSITRIERAIKKQEQIVVFGDYDVDGITGTAILWETLNSLGANVLPYIPHRVDEGYGLSVKGIDHVLALKIKDGSKYTPEKTSLIITVDNGIVANDAVAYAKEKKIDVIITDHHVPSDKKPDAYSIVHTTKLCGAGVAYLLSQSMKYSVSGIKDTYDEDNLLELVALGTIADMVPLTGANRALVKFGLKKMCASQRAGLVALFKEAACEQKTAGVYEVGHVLAPRLNAAGRLESAMESLRLLCTKDQMRATLLAQKLGRTNRDRQTLMFAATQHASSTVRTSTETMKKLLFIAHESYQQGVIGLVAGRLVEEFYRPSIVLSKGEKFSKASARSVHGFNMIEFLRGAEEFLVDVGGHPMAAGFTVETEKLDALQEALEKLADGLITDETLIRSLRVDCELPLSAVDQEMYDALQQLAPFGMGNQEPVFVSRNVDVHDIRIIGKEGKHLKLLVSQGESQTFDALAFGMGERTDELAVGEHIDIAYTIDENTWNGNTKLQLKLKDFHTKQKN